MSAEPQCSKRVHREGYWQGSQCARAGRFVEGGRHYCRQHAPSIRAAVEAEKAKARDAAWDARMAREKRQSAVDEAREDVLHAAREAHGLAWETLDGIKYAVEVLLKAEGA